MRVIRLDLDRAADALFERVFQRAQTTHRGASAEDAKRRAQPQTSRATSTMS